MEKPARPSTAAEAESQPDIDAGPGPGSGSDAWNAQLKKELQQGFTSNDRLDMQRMGKKQQFRVRILLPFSLVALGAKPIPQCAH